MKAIEVMGLRGVVRRGIAELKWDLDQRRDVKISTVDESRVIGGRGWVKRTLARHRGGKKCNDSGWWVKVAKDFEQIRRVKFYRGEELWENLRTNRICERRFECWWK